MEEKNKEETATSEVTSTGGEGCHPRNPVSNSNIPNSNSNPISNPNSNTPRTTKGPKGKSCSGVAFYTSVHKDKSKNPTCIGFSKSLPQVPPYVVGYTEMEASKEGRSLTNFKYGCIGYSVYLDNKDSSAGSKDKAAKLPFCEGLEVVYEGTATTSTAGQVPAHARKTEERGQPTPQPQRTKAPIITTDQFFNRFQKNAGLVATGVVKNLNRVGSYVKETIDDLLYRRPK